MVMELVKVVLLGAAGVGKTSVIQQFSWNEFKERYEPTECKKTCFHSIIINDHLYEIKITDLPPIAHFPADSYAEWAEYRFYGLRSATAYILVFDQSNLDTFQYIRDMREQIVESRDVRGVPLLVVGNKEDLIELSATGGVTPTTVSGTSAEKRRDIQNLVKKHWKCGYVECSARLNWRVVAVFKELMTTIHLLSNTCAYRQICSPIVDRVGDRNRYVL